MKSEKLHNELPQPYHYPPQSSKICQGQTTPNITLVSSIYRQAGQTTPNNLPKATNTGIAYSRIGNATEIRVNPNERVSPNRNGVAREGNRYQVQHEESGKSNEGETSSSAPSTTAEFLFPTSIYACSAI